MFVSISKNLVSAGYPKIWATNEGRGEWLCLSGKLFWKVPRATELPQHNGCPMPSVQPMDTVG